MNPFSPSFGKIPGIYLERHDDVKKYTENIENPNSPYQTTLVYGMRGTGKTAFITDIARNMQKKQNWIVVNLAMGTDLLGVLVDSIYLQSGSMLNKLLSSIQGINVSALGITFSAESRAIDNRQRQVLLERMLRELKKKGISVLITLDEVKDNDEVRRFASVYQVMLREGYQISLIMTGLPENVSALQNNEVLTFLLRSAQIVLKPLELLDVKNSYAKAFRGNREVSDAILNKITKLTKGYAYAFQLMGYYLWEESDSSVTEETVQQVLPLFKADLYRNAYFKMYQSLAPNEKKFLNVMAAKGDEVSFKDITEGFGKEKNYVSVYRRKLLDTQLITASRHGYLQFTLPLFAEFILENKDLL